jgi:hypothetical protein
MARELLSCLLRNRSTMASQGVVLLCAEDDDLELVSWVHNARKHGITPEVVIGVERDDEPLIEALSDPDSRLFVVLRSANLELARVHELKAVFARHRQRGQELLALRLQPEEAEDAIVKIAAKIGRDVRPRSGAYPVVGISERSGTLGLSEKSGTLGLSERSGTLGLSERSGTLALSGKRGADRSGATPLPIADDATPTSSEPTPVFVSPTEPMAIAPAPAPPVAEALDWARRANELEVTEPQLRVESRPFPSAPRDEPHESSTRSRSVAATAATAAAVLMLCALVGGVLWFAAGEWTSPVDGTQRSSVVTPTDGARTEGDTAPSEARIPAMPRGEGGEPTKRRSRARPRATDAELAPLETIEAPVGESSAPVLKPPSPTAAIDPATAEPATAEPATAEPPATAQASPPAPAESGTTAPPAADAGGTTTASATTRPPA